MGMELNSRKIGLCHSFACLALRSVHSSSFFALVCIQRKMYQILLLNSGRFQKWEALAEKQEGRGEGEARVFLPFVLCLWGHLFQQVLLLQLSSDSLSFHPPSSCQAGSSSFIQWSCLLGSSSPASSSAHGW